MLNEVCAYLKNYFDMNDNHEQLPSWEGEFVISDGIIDLSDKILDGQYFRIQGSIFNDGVYEYPALDLTDETFKGKIQAMAVPKDVIKIVSDISEWVERYGGANSSALSPFASESFGGYSYSKGGSNNDGKNTPAWAVLYGGRLSRWRKI